MTIIAACACERLMIADSLVADLDTHTREYHTVKIFRAPDGALVGAAGPTNLQLAFVQWALTPKRTKLAPEALWNIEPRDQPEGLIMLTTGEILYYGCAAPDLVMGDFHAIGSGAIAARAAHRAGATLRRCVEIACEEILNCGGPLTELVLAAPPPARRQRDTSKSRE